MKFFNTDSDGKSLRHFKNFFCKKSQGCGSIIHKKVQNRSGIRRNPLKT